MTCTSWLSGKHLINGFEAEINTSLSFVSLSETFFAQGEEADIIIDEINLLYNNCPDLNQTEAIQQYVNSMGIE